MDKIYDIESIEELSGYLNALNTDEIRKALETEFKSLVEYKDANEWNKLVRICEVFSIIGWINLERVDAICYKSMNIWITELRNKQKEARFLSASWLKRKNGFIYTNPSYHYSPDINEKQSIGWKDFPKADLKEIDVPKLLDQCNKQKVNPIIFSGVYQYQSKIDRSMLFPLLKELRIRLDNNLNVDNFGNGINKIYIHYSTAKPNEEGITRLLKSRFSSKVSEYSADLFIGEEFVLKTEIQRKELLKYIILQVLEDVKKKVIKNKLKYDIDLLISEVKNEASIWID
ncbi:hypothetical protein [Maribacter sp. Asnod2-G09]|uniref:hypothetical protein n=1 Tax=Maribacter sp. Asnod2-G09 TaxID=3160577 RepID=UPI003867973B